MAVTYTFKEVKSLCEKAYDDGWEDAESHYKVNQRPPKHLMEPIKTKKGTWI